MAEGQRPCRRGGAQRQARDGALLRGRGRALGRQARPRHLRPRGQARPALDLQERHLPAGRHRARAKASSPRSNSSVFDAFPDYADLQHAREGAHHLPRPAHHVGRTGVGREPAVERPAQQRARDDHGGRSRSATSSLSRSPFRPARSTPTPAAARRCSARRWSGPPAVRCATTRAKNSSQPHRCTDFEWLDAGVSGKLGAFGSLRLRPRDAAKLGRLLLTDGQWNGKQVIPAGWAAESIKPRINGEGLFFYGYQWWLGRSFRNGSEHHLGGGRRPGRPAPLCRAVARPRGHDQCRSLPRRAAGHHPLRHLQPRRAAGGEGLALHHHEHGDRGRRHHRRRRPAEHALPAATPRTGPSACAGCATIIIATMIGTTMTPFTHGAPDQRLDGIERREADADAQQDGERDHDVERPRLV